MVDPLFQVGGLASGLDTTSIISQLMSLERAPVRRFEQSQDELRSVDSSWSRVVSKLSSFRSSLDDVRKAGSLATLTTASSSDESAVVVTDIDGGEPDSLSFTVEALATRHRVGLSGSFASGSSLVGAGSFTLYDETGGEIGTVTTDASTTLDGLAAQIDGLGGGIDARVLKVDDNDYQLVLSSTTTGLDSQFSATTDITALGTSSALSLGQDAHLSVGGLDIYRGSNTIDDLIPGASIELRDTTTTDVTVSVERDVEQVVDRVKALVDAANGLLNQIATETRYDADTGESGVLQGDSLATGIAFELRSAFAQIVGSGDINYIGQVGISLNQDGTIAFDEEALRSTLAEDPDGVSQFFSATLTGNGGAELSFVGAEAVAGDIGMTVTQAARVATATGASYTPPAGNPKTFTVTTPSGETVSVTIDEGMTAAQAVNRIRAALESAGDSSMTAEVVDDGAGGDAIQLSSIGYGSGASFTVAGYGGDLDGTFNGQDVIADFGSGAVTGTGQSITGDGAAEGLTLQVADEPGSYTYTFGKGLGGALDAWLDSLEGVDGQIQARRDSIDGSISDYDDQILAFEQRLDLREAKLRQQFTALETAMSRLSSQSQWLAGALGSLPTAQQ